MRLISVDELKEWVKNWFVVDRNYHPYRKQNNIPIPELYDILERMPTIEERKTGKWKRTYLDHEAMGERLSIFYCSACNQCIAYPVNYCPSCGADMRGEDHGTD